ncbi:MAG: hypothetical protein AMXMBFR44_0840 [Candidatus Campbellbacteria bacterium]
MKRFVLCATLATFVAALAVSIPAQATDPSPPLAELSMEAPYAPTDINTFCEVQIGLTPAILTEHVLVLPDLTGDRVDRDVGWVDISANPFFVRTVDTTTTSSSIGADRQRDTGEKRGGALRAHPT